MRAGSALVEPVNRAGFNESRSVAIAPLASVIVVATDELHHLRDCLPSLAKQQGPAVEVIVVDNASSDGTADELARAFPWVRVVRAAARLGYAPANNLGFRYASGRYLIVLNPDTRVGTDFVRSLVEASQRHDDRVLVTSRICMYDDPELINTAGNDVHFGLLAACRGLGAPRADYATEEIVASVSGCAFLIPRPVLDDIGPFDESIYPYLEDTELSLRAWLTGYRCITAPNSLVHHKYSVRMHPDKFFFIERNRWMVMLRLYRKRTLALLAPPLVVLEVLAWGYAARQGAAHGAAKARSYLAILRLLPTVRRGRRDARVIRRVGDTVLLAQMQGNMHVTALLADSGPPPRLLTLLNAGFGAYLGFLRRVVRW
jgi:GT2 family glycosyltransferase